MNEPTDRITLNLAALTDDQRDGFTCVVCSADLATGGPSVPVGTVPGGLEFLGGQVFACASHLTDDQRSGLACVVCERDYLTETTPTPHVPVGRVDGGQVFACTSHVQDATSGERDDADTRERATWPDVADMALRLRDNTCRLREVARNVSEPVASALDALADAQAHLCDMLADGTDISDARNALAPLIARARYMLDEQRCRERREL